MRHPSLFKKNTALFISILLLTSCGGGGGGDDTTTINWVSITKANVETITSDIIKSITSVQIIDAGMSVISLAPRPAGEKLSLNDLILQQSRLTLEESSSALIVEPANFVIGPIPQDCPDGGTVDLTVNVADLSTITVGDVISLSYNNCISDGVVMNGKMSITVTFLSAGYTGIPPYTLGADILLTSFSVNDGVLTITGSGLVALLETDDGLGLVSQDFSGATFTSVVNGATLTLSNYGFVRSINIVSGDISFDLNGTVSSARIGGAAMFDSTTPFTSNVNVANENPTQGVMRISTLKDASNALVTALADGISVQIDVDEDGDGIYEVNSLTTWADIESI